MQRIIKFRAWDGKYKKMRYKVVVGNLHDEVNYTAHAVYLKPGDTEYNIDFPGRWMNFDEHSNFVLMQFTGLTDKNGKEIYEGDILQQWFIENHGKVFYSGSCFKVECDGEPIIHTLDAYDMKDIVVIGNIHENPELCKG